MLLVYRIIFIIALIVSSPYLLIKALWGRHGVKERLGLIPKRMSTGRLFWFHAASVGELKVLSSVIPEIMRLTPDLEIAISTTTATGKKRARELFGGSATIFLLPLEFSSAILRALGNLRPEKLIMVETEIWPLLIITSANQGVQVSIINARMSESSFRLYKWLKPFVRQVLKRLRHVLAQTDADAKRFVDLGAPEPQVLGNIKFDQALILSQNERAPLQLRNNDRLVFVAGSIRRGEDRLFGDLIARCEDEGLPVFFVLVPRHMKDVGELRAVLQKKNIRFGLWSETHNERIDTSSVLLVDTMGELTDFYGTADVAFVGGSLVSIGGHDPIEPAALGKPVVFGPHMENAAMAANLLLESGGAALVKDANDLLGVLRDAVGNRTVLAEKGRRCREAVFARAGVAKEIARVLAEDSN